MGRRVWYVKANSTGGTGTIVDPFGSIDEALQIARGGDAIAVSAGSFSEGLTLSSTVSIFGVCPTRTILTGTISIGRSAVVDLHGFTVRPGGSSGAIEVRRASAVLSRIAIEDSKSVGLAVLDRANTLASDVSLCSNRGGGILVRGASLSVSRASFLENTGFALGADRGARAHGADLWIDGTRADPSTEAPRGRGISVTNGASAAIERARISSCKSAGIACIASSVRITDVVVRDTRLGDNGDPYGHGIVVKTSGSRFDASRVALLGNDERGIDLTDTASASASDLTIVGPGMDVPTGFGGAGMSVGATNLSLTRASVARNANVGVGVSSSASGSVTCEDGAARKEVRLTDIDISQIVLGHQSVLGIQMQCNVHLVLERVRIDGSRGGGTALCSNLVAGEGPTVDSTDLDIEQVSDDGINITNGKGSFFRTRIRGARTYGITLGFTSSVSMSLVETGTTTVGFEAEDTSHLTVRDFSSTWNHSHGAMVRGTAILELHQGVIADNPVGAEAIQAGYPLELLLDRVVYRANGVDIIQTAGN
jgi:hypothetical protein